MCKMNCYGKVVFHLEVLQTRPNTIFWDKKKIGLNIKKCDFNLHYRNQILETQIGNIVIIINDLK